MRARRAIIGVGMLLAGLFVAHSPATAAPVTIDFDDSAQPSGFVDTVALTDEYAAQGVTFSGPAPGDGGAVLDESSNFDVTGYSAPNFLAFNLDVQNVLQDGGTPEGPETLTFSSPVDSLSFYAAAPQNGQVTVEAYDAEDQLVDSDTLDLAMSGVRPSVSGAGITRAVISFTSEWLVVDDLTFDLNSAPVADAGADQSVTLGATGAEVTLDGSGSSDPEDDELTYTWTGPFVGGTTTGVSPVVAFTGVGTYEVTLEVSDGTLAATDTVVIRVTAPAPTTSTTSPSTTSTSTPATTPAPGAQPVVAAPTYTG